MHALVVLELQLKKIGDCCKLSKKFHLRFTDSLVLLNCSLKILEIVIASFLVDLGIRWTSGKDLRCFKIQNIIFVINEECCT